MAKRLDAASIQDYLARLEEIPQDATPKWGTMNRAQLFWHLTSTIHYTTGKGKEMPYRGNWKTRNIFRHVILNHWKKIPHNIPLPNNEGKGRMPFEEGAMEDLRAALDEYASQFDSGNLPERTHPYFGVLNADQWRRFHIAHLNHHCEQFGV